MLRIREGAIRLRLLDYLDIQNCKRLGNRQHTSWNIYGDVHGSCWRRHHDAGHRHCRSILHFRPTRTLAPLPHKTIGVWGRCPQETCGTPSNELSYLD